MIKNCVKCRLLSYYTVFFIFGQILRFFHHRFLTRFGFFRVSTRTMWAVCLQITWPPSQKVRAMTPRSPTRGQARCLHNTSNIMHVHQRVFIAIIINQNVFLIGIITVAQQINDLFFNDDKILRYLYSSTTPCVIKL